MRGQWSGENGEHKICVFYNTKLKKTTTTTNKGSSAKYRLGSPSPLLWGNVKPLLEVFCTRNGILNTGVGKEAGKYMKME